MPTLARKASTSDLSTRLSTAASLNSAPNSRSVCSPGWRSPPAAAGPGEGAEESGQRNSKRRLSLQRREGEGKERQGEGEEMVGTISRPQNAFPNFLRAILAQYNLERRSPVLRGLSSREGRDKGSTCVSSSDRCACFRLRDRRADSLLDSILQGKGKRQGETRDQATTAMRTRTGRGVRRSMVLERRRCCMGLPCLAPALR